MNEIDPNALKIAKGWIIDCSRNDFDEELREDWCSVATDAQVVSMVDRTFDGGWAGFLLTL